MKTKIWTFSTWLWLLSLAVLVAIYGAWLIYPLEIDWLKLSLQVTITKDELLKNFNILMTYLKNSRAEKSLFLHQRAFTLAAILPIIIVVAGLLIGFDQFFTLFHEALFPGDSSWLFNPATDPVIWVLPEEYFMHCFIIFFVAYEAMMLSLVAIARKQLNHHLKNNERKDEK